MAQIPIADRVARDAAPIVGADLIMGLRLEPDGNFQPVVETVATFLSGIHQQVPNFPSDFRSPALAYVQSTSELHLTYLDRNGQSQDLSTIIPISSGGGTTTGGGQSAAQVQAAIMAGIISGVEAWARKGQADKIPLIKINLDELEAYLDRQDLLPKDMEVLLSSRPHIFGHSNSQAITFDAGEARPTTGTLYFDIQNHVVQVDAAALEATSGGTLGQDLTSAPGSYLIIPNAISSDNDGRFNVELYVAKDIDSTGRVFVQISGSTNLNRQVEITATYDIPIVTEVAYNSTTRTVTTTRRQGTNTTHTSFQLPTDNTPVTPTSALLPPNEFYSEQLTAAATTFEDDDDSTLLPTEGGFDVHLTLPSGVVEVVRSDDFLFEDLREKTAAAAGDTPSNTNAISGTAPSGDFWIGRTAANHALGSNRGDSEARTMDIVSHYAIKADPPTVYFDLEITLTNTNNNIWQEDPGANVYDPSTDGTLDFFAGTEDVDDFRARYWSALPVVTTGSTRRGNEGVAIGNLGAIARGADNKFRFVTSTQFISTGTTVHPRVVGQPITYVRTDALDALVAAFLSEHSGITYSTTTRQLSYQWAEADLDTAVRNKLNRTTDLSGVQQFAKDTTTQIPKDKLPFISWAPAATPADLSNRTVLGPAGFHITAPFTYADVEYQIGEQVVKTAQGTFYKIVKVTQEDVPSLPLDQSSYQVMVVETTPRYDLEYTPAQHGTSLTLQYRGGPGEGTITHRRGRTANDINNDILLWYFSVNNNVFHLYTALDSTGGAYWDAAWIDGVKYDLTATGVLQGIGSVPYGTAALTRASYYTITLPGNPFANKATLTLNLEDNEATRGERFFVGNPKPAIRLAAQGIVGTQESFGIALPTTPQNGAIFILASDTTLATFTDENAQAATQGRSGDIFQYDSATSRWIRRYTPYTYRPIPSATQGNTDTFPTGQDGKVVFERVSAADGLPARSDRPANSLLIDASGRPTLNLSDKQVALALLDETVQRGGETFPAHEELPATATEFRFQGLDHEAPVRSDKLISWPTWTNREYQGGRPGGRVQHQGVAFAQNVNAPIHNIEYYTQDHFETANAGRVVISFFGDSGRNFGPHTLVVYPQGSTDRDRDAQEYALVADGPRWRTAIQLTDRDRPETGTSTPIAKTLEYNIRNGDGNYLFVTDDSIEPKYVRSNSDTFNRMRRPVRLWTINATELALMRNGGGSEWNTNKDNPQNWIHLNDIPRAPLFMVVKQVHPSNTGLTTAKYTTKVFGGDMLHDMYKTGDRRTGRQNQEGANDDYGLNRRPIFYLLGPGNESTSADANVLRINWPGNNVTDFGISNHDSRLSWVSDNNGYWGNNSIVELWSV